MNYQLMFQTIFGICAIATFLCFWVWIVWSSSRHEPKLTAVLIGLFIITLITGALAAGLS